MTSDVSMSHGPEAPAAATPGSPSATGSTSPLGQILVRLGVVDAVDVMLAAYEQDLGDGRRIGEILMARGLASREDIQLAVLDQTQEDVALPSPRPVPQTDGPDLDFPTPQGGWLRTTQTLVLFGLLTAAAMVLSSVTGGPALGVAAYGLLSIPYLLAKLVLSSFYRATKAPLAAGTSASVVLPFYNEDPATFHACLTALAGQSQPPAHVYLIDDGSATRACHDLALAAASEHPTWSVHRFDENRGKRHAQAWGFASVATDLVVTVDSDTVLHRDALAEIVKPFADPRVNGVTGYARGLNRRKNLLTRLIDLRYTNAFLYERGAYSVLGSVLCATGVLSAWRKDILLDNQTDYLDQRFLGTEVHYGDDRRLTAYALRTGRVVLQDTAIALTSVPEHMPQFVRQQVRWNKSFFRESLLLLRQMRPTRVAWWLGAAEFGYWMVLTTMLLWSVAVRPLVTGTGPSWQYAAFVALMAYARSIRMIGDGGRLLPASFLLAPVYGAMNLLLLVPLRLYSLLRLRDGSWGTRKRRRGVKRAPVAAHRVGPAVPLAQPAPVPRPAHAPEPAAIPLTATTANSLWATGRPCLDVLAG